MKSFKLHKEKTFKNWCSEAKEGLKISFLPTLIHFIFLLIIIGTSIIFFFMNPIAGLVWFLFASIVFSIVYFLND